MRRIACRSRSSTGASASLSSAWPMCSSTCRFRKLGLPRDVVFFFVSMPNRENMVWRLLHAKGVNPYWGEIEHYHNFSRKRLYALLQEHGSQPVEYHVS